MTSDLAFRDTDYLSLNSWKHTTADLIPSQHPHFHDTLIFMLSLIVHSTARTAFWPISGLAEWLYTPLDIGLRWSHDVCAFIIWADRTARRSLQLSSFWWPLREVKYLLSNALLDICLGVVALNVAKFLQSYRMRSSTLLWYHISL